MFYYNTKFRFALPSGSPLDIAGGIIAACAMPAGQLVRRKLRDYPYLQHRLFDPQLYLSSLNSSTARERVIKLASYPWFGPHSVPDYDSKTHGTLKRWKEENEPTLVSTWRGAPLTDFTDRESAVRSAIQFQLDLGCEAIILPVPLTTIATQGFQIEIEWIDCGIEVARTMRVSLPLYATVAISDVILRGVDAVTHPLIHTISSQIASRAELAGAYVVLEQSGDDGYDCRTTEALTAILVLTDDLVRGAGKRVAINYIGSFGLVAAAAGASLWSSGYYLSQRRLRFIDLDEKDGATAYPRYYSLRLAGDIGLNGDIQKAFESGLGDLISADSPAALPLLAALKAGAPLSAVPEWVYEKSNITAAAAHHLHTVHRFGTFVHAQDSGARVEVVSRWLNGAVVLAEKLEKAGIKSSSSTELTHQRVWLNIFDRWRGIAGA